MTLYTPSQNLPYPQSTDSLCEFPAQTKALADAVETAFTTNNGEGDLGRLQVRPFFRASLQVDVTLDLSSGSALIPYDSVDVDTDGMWNIDRSHYGPFAQTNGYYALGVYVSIGPTNATSANDGLFQVTVVPGPGVTFMNGDSATLTKWDGGLNNALSASCITVMARVNTAVSPTLATIPSFTVQYQKFGTYSGTHINDQVIYFMASWMYWVRDL